MAHTTVTVVLILISCHLLGSRQCSADNIHPCTGNDCQPQSDTGPRYCANVERLGVGYDFLKGNPYFPGLDQGYKLIPIFKLAYTTNRKSIDGIFVIPDNVTVIPEYSCTVDLKSATIHNIEDYLYVLDIVAAADFTGFGARFGASADYQLVQDATATRSSQFYVAVAECVSYQASIPTTSQLSQLSDEFIAHVSDLPTSSSAQTDVYSSYQGFISIFGTHFVMNIRMGGRHGFRYEFSTDAAVHMVSNGLNITELATYSSLCDLSGSTSSTTCIAKQGKLKNFQSQIETSTAFSVGGTIGPTTNGTAWFQSVQQHPEPLAYELRPITSLLTSDRFPNDASISKKQSLLKSAISKYCDDLQLQYCSTQPHYPLSPVKNTLISIYTNAVNDNSFWTPKLTSTQQRVMGTLLSCHYHTPTSGTIVLNNQPGKVAQEAIGWDLLYTSANSNIAFFRPRCSDGFNSISDFAVKCTDNCSTSPSTWVRFLPPNMPCLSERCLAQCSASKCTGMNKIKGVTHGYSPFGANSDEMDMSFFRYGDNLSTNYFQCLSMACLDGY